MVVILSVSHEVVEISAFKWFLECLNFQPRKYNRSGMERNEELTVKGRLYIIFHAISICESRCTKQTIVFHPDINAFVASNALLHLMHNVIVKQIIRFVSGN